MSRSITITLSTVRRGQQQAVVTLPGNGIFQYFAHAFRAPSFILIDERKRRGKQEEKREKASQGRKAPKGGKASRKAARSRRRPV